jgi:hypothetical protein
MTEYYDPDDDLISYEDFDNIDEMAWDPDAVEPIDLAELDSGDDLAAPSDAAEELLERIETLDDEIPTDENAKPAADPRLVEDEDSDEEADLGEDDELGEEDLPDEEPPTRERVIRIGGRARMQRLPLGPPPARPQASHRDEEPPAPAAEPDFVYCLALPLPPDLGAEVLELRELGEIDDMPPPGIDLGFAFDTGELAAVERAIAAWAAAHLPLELEMTEIVAEVVGAQQYVAAWHVEPHGTLHDAQIALRHALAPVAAPLAESHPTFQPRITISARVPAHTYPLVIGQMQRDFVPYAWQAGSVALFRAVAGAEPGEWELARTFEPSAGHE